LPAGKTERRRAAERAGVNSAASIHPLIELSLAPFDGGIAVPIKHPKMGFDSISGRQLLGRCQSLERTAIAC